MAKPTVDDFITTFGELEALELSNLEDVNEPTICREKIENAIDLANDLWCGYQVRCKLAGKAAITKAQRWLVLNIARYLMDSLKRRCDITDTYNSCIEFMKESCEMEGDQLTDEELEDLGLTRANTIRFRNTGRRPFTDESLEEYRKDRLYYFGTNTPRN